MIYEMLSGINPFKVRNKNKFEKLQMITDRDIEMRPEFSDSATSLLRGLCKRNVSSAYNDLYPNCPVIVYRLEKDLVHEVWTISSATFSSMESIGKRCMQDKYQHPSFR